MKKIAVITGASAGFGWEIAQSVAALGYRIIITGRRMERLQELKTIIEDKCRAEVLPLAFDIRSQEACEEAINNLPQEWKDIEVLINNAGLAAGTQVFHESNVDDWERMIDTNIKGLLYISRALTPHLVEKKSGHIINISSIAGIGVYPTGHVYCATKHAVNAITKGLRMDLVKYGIKVSSVSPGMAETEFSIVRYHGDKNKAAQVYAGVDALSAKDIADAVSFILERPKHVNIDDILITPTQQANFFVVDRREA